MQNELDPVGFAPIGRLRDESVDHTPIFNAVKQGAQTFKAAAAEQKRRDGLERKKDYVVEDTERDIEQLEQANQPSVAEFVTADPSSEVEPENVHKLRRQGGSATISAELASRRHHLNRLQNAPAEDLTFIQQQYLGRGNTPSAKQFLASEEAARVAQTKALSTEIQDTVKAELGISLPVLDDSTFTQEWVTGDPKWDDVKLVLNETSNRKLQELNNANNPEGIAIRVGAYVSESSKGMIDSVIGQVGKLNGPELEARGQQAINEFRTQLEVRLTHVPAEQRGRLLAQAEKQIGFVERVMTGKALKDEIAIHQARANLNNTYLNAKKIKTDTKLSEAQIAAADLKLQRENFENVNKLESAFQTMQDKLVLMESRDGAIDTSKLSPMERIMYENPEAVENFQVMAYDAIGGLLDVNLAAAGSVDIGEAGNVQFTGDARALPTEKVVDVAEVYLSALANGNNPFTGADGEKGLKLFMDFTATRMNTLSAPQRQQAFNKLRPIMNTPEFAEIAAANPRAFKPWVNLVQAETHQRGANMLGALGQDLYNDGNYKAAIAGVKTNIDADINSGAAFRRAQIEAQPEFFAEKTRAPLATLAAKLEEGGGDSGIVGEIVGEMQKHGTERYLNFFGKQGFQDNVAKDLRAAAAKLEDGTGAKKEVEAIISAADKYYEGRANIVKNKLVNASNPTDVYETLADVAVVDQEHFDSTGEYRMVPSGSFLEAFKDHPRVVEVTRNRLALHNNGAEVKGFRNSLITSKNITGAATVQDSYEMFRLSRPARATGSLTPSLREEAPIEGFQP